MNDILERAGKVARPFDGGVQTCMKCGLPMHINRSMLAWVHADGSPICAEVKA